MKAVYEETSHLLFFPAHFRIYNDKIEAYLWPFKYEIPISDIVNVKIINKIPWYVGWGLKIWFGRKLYFAIHHGKSIEIERKNSYWRKIILSVKDPEKIVKLIKSKILGKR